jgi:hypothetical protein
VRLILLMLAVVVVAAGAVFAACIAAGHHPRPIEPILAVAVCLIAGIGGAVPLLLNTNRSQATIAQAALIGTAVHLFACAALGGGMILLKPFGLQPAFVYWLLGLYWLTLIALATGYIRALKAAPIAGQP